MVPSKTERIVPYTGMKSPGGGFGDPRYEGRLAPRAVTWRQTALKSGLWEIENFRKSGPRPPDLETTFAI